ncbi:MAG: DUF3301 domain-containing protein [Pseudomonadales bacterium]|nr:DUF3301 domain-containing protein [Pseudomonadales bacterium]
MILTIENLAIAVLVGSLLYLLWLGLAAREQLLRALDIFCVNQGLQLLDESVVLRSLSLGRNRRGKWRIRRVYSFEFSSLGDDRYNGLVTFFDNRIVNSRLDPYRIVCAENEE